MGELTLPGYLRYIYYRLTLWFKETEDEESDTTVGSEHLEYIGHSLRGLQEAIEHCEDWQLEEVCEEIGWAIANSQMGARFKGEYAINILPELINAIERRATAQDAG